MGVNFSPFEIGRRALRASQLGLTVTGQNIANVNTPGYTRQAVQLSPDPSLGVTGALIGTGVTIDGVRSFRDQFIDARLQTETAIAGRLTAQRDALAPVEAAFSETGQGGGLRDALNNFFGAFRDLEAHPSSVPVRTAVVQQAGELASAFHATRGRLLDIRAAADHALSANTGQVNQLAQQVATLNARISNFEDQGANASELRNQREEAVRQLAELTGARTVEDQSGQITLTLGDGRALVIGDHAADFQATPTVPSGLSVLTLDGKPAVVSDGKLRGLLDAIDEIGAQITALDQFAQEVATRVNTLHASGTDLNGNAGGNFFEVPAGGAPITAANIAVASTVQANPRLVVASPLATPTSAATVAGAIANLLTDTNSQVGTRTGSFNSIYASIVAEAGASVKSADDSLSLQQAILAQTTAQRESISGVSLDEEAINLLQFQKAYEAAARFLKIADEMTQTILALGQ